MYVRHAEGREPLMEESAQSLEELFSTTYLKFAVKIAYMDNILFI